MSGAETLHGTGVLITRPLHQSEHLRWLIEQTGGSAVVVPAIEIVDFCNHPRLKEIATRLNEFDIAIFISANAVTKGLGWLRGNRVPWPKGVRIGAVGRSTADALVKHGVKVDLIPTKYDSEGLLTLPVMQEMDGKRVVIFRGRGGREHLASTLVERGAQVEYAEVYERRRPEIGLSEQLNEEQRKQIDVIVTTSSEGLKNLIAMTDPDLRGWLLNKSLVVFSDRAADQAKALGFNSTIAVAPQASDDAIVSTIRKIIEC